MHRSRRALWLLAAVGLGLVGCGGGGGGSGDIGQAGNKADAKRVIEVQVTDERFIPDFLNVTPSETVTLRVTNKGTKIHEFFLGNEEDHEERENLMRQMGSAPMNMADTANSLTIDPGATEEITWGFPKGGSVLFGSHQPGEYAKGMKGEIKVSD